MRLFLGSVVLAAMSLPFTIAAQTTPAPAPAPAPTAPAAKAAPDTTTPDAKSTPKAKPAGKRHPKPTKATKAASEKTPA